MNGQQIEYILLGTFIIDIPKTDEVTEKTKFTGYDYLVKFDTPYINENTYPISLYNFLTNLCSQVGLQLENNTIVNGNYQVLGNPFTNNENRRLVLEQICQLCGGFAKITTENKVEVVNLHENENLETFDGSIYTSLSKNKKYGKINSVTLNLSDIEGESTNRKNQASIDENGLTEVVISDNYFLINAAEREKAITELFNVLDGIEYVPFEMQDYGLPYMELGDGIEIKDTDNVSFYSYILDFKFKYDGSYSATTKAAVQTEIQKNSTLNSSTRQTLRKVERSVDKINGKIEDIIEEQSEFESTLVQVQEDVNGIREEVQSITEFDREVIGTNIIHLANSSEREDTLLELKIAGDMEYVYPSSTTYPSEQLYPVGQYINIIIDKNPRGNISDEAQRIHIDLLEPLRYLNQNVFDEIRIVDKNMKLIRRVGLNANGEKYELENAIETDLGEIHLKSFKEDTYIYVLESYVLNLKARYLIDNAYIETFATKVETDAKIEIAKGQINLGVAATYETKEDAQTKYSQILLNENSITTEVNKKVNESEFGTKIQQNAEAVKYAWNQISQYIQLEIINNKVCLAIRDSSNKLLMIIDQDGQHFYDQNKQIVETKAMPSSSLPTLFFNVDGDNVVNNQGIYNTALGFSVSMTSQSDGKKYYYPMFYWGRLATNQNQGVHVKEKLIFDDGDESASQSPYINKNNGGLVFLVKDGTNIQVRTLNNKVVATIGQGSFCIYDSSQNKLVELYKNSNNTYTINMPNVSIFADSLSLSDNGYFSTGSMNAETMMSTPFIEADNVPYVCNCATISARSDYLHVDSKDGTADLFFRPDWTSDARLKENIETSDKDSLELINSIPHYAFDWKKDGKHEDIGYIAQELEAVDKNLVNKYEVTNENDEVVDYDWTINDRYIIANLTRAVQQQQELIDYLYSQLKIKKNKSKKIKKEKYEKDYGEKTKINFKYEKDKLKIQEIKEKLKGGKQGTK